MRLYFVRIFPMLFAIGIIYHLQLIDRIEEVPYTEIHWRKDLQKQDSLRLQGKALFRQYCSACHPYKIKHRMPASDLKGVQKRWSIYPANDLVQFIRTPDSLLQNQHPRAVELLEGTYSKPGFPELDNQQIESILYFLDQEVDP
ncbi:MAG: c-type cytochrome [Saprospiraceae bacterium]|nr:c-type cytochrome [Saprospiraceae bacterium]